VHGIEKMRFGPSLAAIGALTAISVTQTYTVFGAAWAGETEVGVRAHLDHQSPRGPQVTRDRAPRTRFFAGRRRIEPAFPGRRIFNRDRADAPSSNPTVHYHLSVSCQTPSQSAGRVKKRVAEAASLRAPRYATPGRNPL